MNEFKFWIQSEERVTFIKTEFDNYYKGENNPLTITQDGDGSWMLELNNINNIDLLLLFHSGVEFGLKKGFGRI